MSPVEVLAAAVAPYVSAVFRTYDYIDAGRPGREVHRNVANPPNVPDTADGWRLIECGLHAHGCAILDLIDGKPRLTLPPIVPDGEPVVWTHSPSPETPDV